MYTYNILTDTQAAKVNSDKLSRDISGSSISVILTRLEISGSELVVVFSSTISISEELILDGIISSHDGEPIPEVQEVPTQVKTMPFSSNTITVDGETKGLYKRVHGVNVVIPAGQTGYLDFVSPYSATKFTGAEIFGGVIGDSLDFFVLDSVNNDYSGAPGSHYILNQFGFDVQMCPGGKYANTSNYDADIYYGMVINCAFKNNGTEDKIIAMNVWLHEVK